MNGENTKIKRKSKKIRMRQQKEWRKKNPLKAKEQRRRYRTKRPEKHREQVKKWQKKNPERVKMYHKNVQYRRRSRIKDVGNHTLAQWERLKKKYNHCCANCGMQEPFTNQWYQKLTEDHIVPISKGGLNDIKNIQPFCWNCNNRKSNNEKNNNN